MTTNELIQQIEVGDTVAWENGLGGTETEVVFLSKRTGRTAVPALFGNETSIWSLAQIDNKLRIVKKAQFDYSKIANAKTSGDLLSALTSAAKRTR